MLQTFIRARTAHAVRPFVRNLSDDIAKASSRIFTTDEDRRRRIEEIIRVDHAGEYGAVRIYEGQMAVLGRTAAGPVIEVCERPHRRPSCTTHGTAAPLGRRGIYARYDAEYLVAPSSPCVRVHGDAEA